jgi:hypothetical protein
MKKFTLEEFEKLSKEEKRKAIIEFREPSQIYSSKYMNIKKIDQDNYK